ncbi:unnamed protein product [Heterobilharzia americana]|nr:unnamed protein product [Heterobilharzia americana]
MSLPCEYPCVRTHCLTPITKSLNAQKSVNSSPFSFIISPCASRPMMSSLPVLSPPPSLAFISPHPLEF